VKRKRDEGDVHYNHHDDDDELPRWYDVSAQILVQQVRFSTTGNFMLASLSLVSMMRWTADGGSHQKHPILPATAVT
jgi:hypothetical protein